MSKELIKIKNISKIYTDEVGYKIHLLENVSFTINKNEFVSILAPKGSGKTSLLKIISNLNDYTKGDIENPNKVVFIPSQPSSFPWLNVLENIKFHSQLNSDEIQEIINLVGLSGYEDHFPDNNSEGFRFRISLGRALAHFPDIVVIDEPFNSFNSETRKEVYSLLRSVFNRKEISIVLGTTNISEAILLSDKIYLMKKSPGEIINEVNIELPKDRNIKLFESSDFIDIRTQIERTFRKNIESHFYNFSV